MVSRQRTKGDLSLPPLPTAPLGVWIKISTLTVSVGLKGLPRPQYETKKPEPSVLKRSRKTK